MNFNRHYGLEGKHAYLSPSKPSWSNYDEEKFDRAYLTHLAAKRGTDMHAVASELIRLRIPQADNGATFNSYVNDAIGYRMTPEVPLFYSENAFGHADALGFRKNKVRVHDLKTGITPSNMRQLELYDALFCLEYKMNPFQIEHELRIYQNDDVKIHVPDGDDIFRLMEMIKFFDKRITEIKEETLE